MLVYQYVLTLILPRLLVVIEKERPMCQTTDQMVAPAVLD